jgi:hypothetical protein
MIWLLCFCESCIVGKFKKGTSPKQSYSRASRAGELFHSDLCGPLDVTLFGHRYILTFTDDYSRYKVAICSNLKLNFFLNSKRLILETTISLQNIYLYCAQTKGRNTRTQTLINTAKRMASSSNTLPGTPLARMGWPNVLT